MLYRKGNETLKESTQKLSTQQEEYDAIVKLVDWGFTQKGFCIQFVDSASC